MKTLSPSSFTKWFLAAAITAFAVLPVAGNAQAQNQPQNQNSGDGEGIKGFWECETSTGNFVIALNQIASVAKHQYIVDGAAKVYEVTVDSTGPMVARFYFIEPVTDGSPLSMGKNTIDRLKDIAQNATSKTGTEEIWEDVIKNYPQTTHAKTAEFRLRNKENIQQIYDHIYRVWAKERGRGQFNKLTIQDE